MPVSNFDFLKAEWPDLHEAAGKAEALAHPDARTACFHARRGLLRRGAPGFFELAEVVGRWVWIQFESEPAVETRRQLAQLGFHWNNARQAWQHPCGVYRDERVTFDPRRKFGSYFAADMMLP
jgi:hypothetical protein